MLFSSILSLALAGGASASAGAEASDLSTGCAKKHIPSDFPKPGESKVVHPPDSDREYRLYIPDGYTPGVAAPVYFSFHGAGGTMDVQEDLSQFSNPEFNPGGIAIYPNSTNGYWLSNPNAITTRPNDLDFVDAILNQVEAELCVQKKEIYSAGKSNGGGFTAVIACDAKVGSRFAAFASVSGAYYDTDNIPGVGPCDPAPREGGYPFLEFHGTNDTTAPIDGNTKKHPKYPVIDFLHGWAERNNCGEKAQPTTNETWPEHPLVTRADWDCEDKNGTMRRGIVQHYRESENGHCWPSTKSNSDYKKHPDQCSRGKYVFNATSVIFDFFSHYQLGR
ncbi:hypothetical protein N7492_005479 [Penicillium capsulatum]|uniref:feruloyl esterase n=1 Tax=Penicillium capsulatum TaxID=69766 RepID=A0A9W9LRP7_9EURO|nr:hypothetical protein N7492_005479 [Penicillium capsulatum]